MSLFNPWVMLALICAFLGVGAFSYSKGEDAEFDRQQIRIAKLNEESRQKEQALVSAVTTTATQLVKANNNAKLQTQKLHSALDAGTLRLRLPVKATSCPVQASSDSPIASGDSSQEGGELDATTAKTLIAITDDGDEAIRQLTSCQQAYESIYQTLKEKP